MPSVGRTRLFASTMLLGASLAATGAGAQAMSPAVPVSGQPATTQAGETAASTAVQEVVVTGSLFRRTDRETPSPVTTLSAQEITNAGITTIADAIRSVSADNSGTIPTAFGLGFAAGSSGVALRGLTVNSTLVLIDGARTAPYALADDGERSFVDLNTIPIGVLDRVEVLKDGASSIYGADAIAGVVNVILKPSFVGVQADAEVGDSEHGGGFERRVSGLFGIGDLQTDRYNVYGSFEYEQDDRIRVSQRGFPFNTTDLSSLGGNNLIGGQPGLNSGSIYGTVTPSGGGFPRTLRSCGPPTVAAIDGTGEAYCAQDFAKYGDDQPADQRYGFYGRATAQFTPNLQGYVSGSYFQNLVTIDEAPSQIQNSVPTNTNSISLPATLANGSLNPNNPFAALGESALINYAFGDIPAKLTVDNHVARIVGGLKGDAFGWHFDADVVAAHTWLDYTDLGLINYPALITAINTGSYSFINPAQNSPAIRAALSPTLAKTSTTDLDTIDLRATRDLFELPGGALALGVGGSFRYEAQNDPDLNANLQTQGLGVAQTAGYRTVASAFAEIDAPVLKQLEINGSARFDHYSDFGDNVSPKVGIKYKATRQLVLRGTYSQGFRAPSFSENGSSASEGFVTFTPSDAAFLKAHTVNGVVDQYAQSYSLALLSSANPQIKPETSESFTGGLIFEPARFFSVSVDYYHIRKHGVIAQSSPSVALGDYFSGAALPPGFKVTADLPDPAAPGALARPVVISSPYINANALETTGLDVDAQAHLDLPADIKFVSDLNVTDIFTFNYTQQGVTEDYVGSQAPYQLSSGAGTPRYRVTWENTFTHGPLSVTATMYYVSPISEVAIDTFGPGGCAYTNAVGGAFPSGCHIKSFTDVDLTGSFKVTPKIEVYANILNLFDRSPPIDPADYAGVNYNPTYAQAGIVGRFFRLGARAKF